MSNPLSEGNKGTRTILQERYKYSTVGLIINPKTRADTAGKIGAEPSGQVACKSPSNYLDNFGTPYKNVGDNTQVETPNNRSLEFFLIFQGVRLYTS